MGLCTYCCNQIFKFLNIGKSLFHCIFLYHFCCMVLFGYNKSYRDVIVKISSCIDRHLAFFFLKYHYYK